MKKTTTAARSNPVVSDPEVVAFRAQFDERSPLDEIVRSGAQQMLQAAIDAEVTEFLQTHSGHVDENGKRLVVRNGHHPSRELLTGADRRHASILDPHFLAQAGQLLLKLFDASLQANPRVCAVGSPASRVGRGVLRHRDDVQHGRLDVSRPALG